ncbi:MAG: tail fiber domain-containing protein [Marinifilaceae bacterium]|nr:tail fiber domain-containing protein [Marinifilaceae bacterium]
MNLKTNITNLQSPLNKTLQLRPVKYSLTNSYPEKTNQDIGFIAQELE